MSEWISLIDRQPNVLDVWVKLTDGSVIACWSQIDGDYYWNGCGTECYILEDCVTHWMPRDQQ